jgi:prepilin-type processing-associated H-X9-DG protein
MAILPPTSFHSGGVNVSLCDGTVHFVTDTVDVGDLEAAGDVDGTAAVNSGKKCRRAAASPFGVWGALGSRNAGEVVMLP